MRPNLGTSVTTAQALKKLVIIRQRYFVHWNIAAFLIDDDPLSILSVTEAGLSAYAAAKNILDQFRQYALGFATHDRIHPRKRAMQSLAHRAVAIAAPEYYVDGWIARLEELCQNQRWNVLTECGTEPYYPRTH